MRKNKLIMCCLLISRISFSNCIYAMEVNKDTSVLVDNYITNNELDDYLSIECEEESLEDYIHYKEISSRVYNTQKTLKYLGYYEGELTGIFDGKTLESLIIFQNKKGLVGNGRLTTSTLEKINNLRQQVEELENKEFNKRIQESRMKVKNEIKTTNSAKLVDWFKEGQYILPRKSIFKVTDVVTNKSFMVYRMGGINHCDVEPLTKQDTEIMRSIYGRWRWDRRAIVIQPQNSEIRIAASMAGMPHGKQHKTGNNFNGHFDIHLYNSKTHYDPSNGIYVAKIEPWHQQTLKLAVGK